MQQKDYVKCLIDLKDYERDPEDLERGGYFGIPEKYAKEIYVKGRRHELVTLTPQGEPSTIVIRVVLGSPIDGISLFVPAKYFSFVLEEEGNRR